MAALGLKILKHSTFKSLVSRAEAFEFQKAFMHPGLIVNRKLSYSGVILPTKSDIEITKRVLRAYQYSKSDKKILRRIEVGARMFGMN